MVRPSPPEMLGRTVGAGLSAATDCLTVILVNGWLKGVVGGLPGPPPGPLSRKWPALLRALTLNPDTGASKPAVVSSPILIMSRRLKPAEIISRLFFAACCFSFSAFLLVFQMFAIACSPSNPLVAPVARLLKAGEVVAQRREDGRAVCAPHVADEGVGA